MADHAHAHGHGHAPDHVPHVTPVKVYLATWAALIFLTAVTVGASYVDFGPGNLVIALFIATVKAAVVAALFMHLLHDHKFHTLILMSGALFLIIFVAFTMFDTEYRGRADAFEGERPADITRPFEGTKSLAAMRAKYATAGAPGAASAAPAGAGAAPAASAAPAAPAASAPASASVAPEASASAAPAASGSAAPAASASAAPAASP